MRPTARFVLLVGAGAPLALLLVLVDESLWAAGLLYAVGMFGLLAVDYVMAPRRRDVSVRIDPPRAALIGEPAAIGIAIEAPPPGAGTGRLIADLSGPVGPAATLPFVLAGATERLRLALNPTRRGIVGLDALWLDWQGPLGLARQVKRLAPSIAIPVLPNTQPIRREALRLRHHEGFHGNKPQIERGEGTAFDSMREFVPGMDHRAIDWKHSARHMKLVCKEYEAERNHQIIVAMDTGRLMSEPLGGISRLDHAANAALLLAYVSLRHGDRIGMYSFAATPGSFLDPVSRMQDFPKLQESMARLAYSESETNYTLGLTRLAGRLRRRSLIVLFTEFVDTVTAELMIENVAHLNRRHLILFVSLGDPDLQQRIDATPRGMRDIAGAVVAHSLAHERDTVYERLRRLGVQCVEARDDLMPSELVNRYLDVKRREMI